MILGFLWFLIFHGALRELYESPFHIPNWCLQVPFPSVFSGTSVVNYFRDMRARKEIPEDE